MSVYELRSDCLIDGVNFDETRIRSGVAEDEYSYISADSLFCSKRVQLDGTVPR